MDEELSLEIVKKKKLKIIRNIFKIIIILLFPIVLFLSIELLNGMDANGIKIAKGLFGYNGSVKLLFKGIKTGIKIIYTYYIGKKWINILLISALLAGIYGITGRLRRSMIITTVITMALAIVNYLLIEMRGTAITPSDFYSIMMATKLANSVSLTIPVLIFVSIGVTVVWIFWCKRLKFREIDKKKKIIIRIISGICCIVTFVVFFSTDLLNIRISYNTKNFYKRNGVCASFLTILKEMSFDKPEGYSIDVIKQQLGQNKTEDSIIADNKKQREKPNIIAIMNESLSDLKDIYDLDITEDNMPFIHSLKENTIKANVHSTAIGSKTANCEWEFLTGNSTRFLPTEAVAYEQYIKKETYSLVNLMNAQGYYTSAYHPYNPEGYNRMLIYPLMGFEEYKFRNELTELNEVRYDYADDLSTYKNIINLFENKKDGEKIFNFTITMQNHMAYKDADFENTVFLEGYDREQYSEINQYLSSVKLSDEAFKYLIEYFEKYDEPTIIMMYGDHQPGFVENYPEIFGETNEEEYEANKYITPMILWANYDIEEYEIEDISMNYLSLVLFDEAGLEKSRYMEYLEEMYYKYPVINSNVYKDSQGIFYSDDQEPDEFKLYEYIQYNNMFDDEKLNYLFE